MEKKRIKDKALRGIIDQTLKMVPYIGDIARIKAKAYNTPIYYIEEGKIIEEMPDGTKRVVKESAKQ